MESLNKIKIYKSFLNVDEYNHVLNDLFYNGQWKFGWRSNYDNTSMPPFWKCDLNDDVYYSEYLKNKIEKICGKKLHCHRVYANAKTYGQDGDYHIDLEDINDVKDDMIEYTFCLYITPLKNNEKNVIGGELQFKLPELDDEIYELNILCHPNLGVLFPAHFKHRGMAYKRYTHELRICIAWKFKELK